MYISFNKIINPNTESGFIWKFFKYWVYKNRVDLIAYLYIFFLIVILFRLVMYSIFFIILKKTFFINLRKRKIVKKLIDFYFYKRLRLIFYSKLFIYYLIYYFWSYGFINKYKYEYIFILTVLINVIYTLTLSFYRKRNASELKHALKMSKTYFYYKVL